MTSLVTGSAGHLGEALVRTLRAADAGVRGIDIRPSPFTDLVGSITDGDMLRRAMAGVDTVYHAATLHKPHVVTHSAQDFIDTNVGGTAALLEASVEAGARAFVLTSTTSVFGDALRPPPGAPAVWVTESVTPVPKNIYGVTKQAAESLCQLFHREHGLGVVVLRTSRFFPEEDDDPARRSGWEQDNVKANEYLNRRVDLADCVDAHLRAAARASELGFARYVISATTPFERSDAEALATDARSVVSRRVPLVDEVYPRLGWRLFDRLDRVYVNEAARRDLGWEPRFDFAHVLERLAAGEDMRSELAIAVGSKGYHDETFESGPYPVTPP